MTEDFQPAGRIEISPDAVVGTFTIRPWTREERLHWYRTGRNLYRPEWMYQAIIDDHPELPRLNRSWDNLYGGSFED
ncbi:hypothetical protein [Streptomyces collinus]|uniref:hypothetical protein n=1 Tax=Streptomyces collinus TaxID=42684 RepID=UPI0037F9D053